MGASARITRPRIVGPSPVSGPTWGERKVRGGPSLYWHTLCHILARDGVKRRVRGMPCRRTGQPGSFVPQERLDVRPRPRPGFPSDDGVRRLPPWGPPKPRSTIRSRDNWPKNFRISSNLKGVFGVVRILFFGAVFGSEVAIRFQLPCFSRSRSIHLHSAKFLFSCVYEIDIGLRTITSIFAVLFLPTCQVLWHMPRKL